MVVRVAVDYQTQEVCMYISPSSVHFSVLKTTRKSGGLNPTRCGDGPQGVEISWFPSWPSDEEDGTVFIQH